MPVIGVQHELFGVFTRGQVVQDLARFGVDHLNRVTVRGTDVEHTVIMGKDDPARAFAGFDGARDL